jgi:hypothetical protein
VSDRRGDYRFDAKSIRVDDKGGEVVRAVGGAQTRCTVIHASVREGLGMEARDRLARRRGKGKMESRAGRRRIARLELDGEQVLTRSYSIADGARVRPDADIAECRKRGVVERGGTLEVGNTEGYVVQHPAYPGGLLAFSMNEENMM